MNPITGISDFQIRGSPPNGPAPGTESQAVRAPQEGLTEDFAKSASLAQQPPHQAVEQAADGVNSFLKSSGSHVQFSVQKGAKRLMVEVIDNKTDEVIRTIPSKELLDLAGKIGEMVGMFVDRKG